MWISIPMVFVPVRSPF